MADDLIIGIGADPSGLGRGLGRAEEMVDQFVDRVQRIGDVGRELTSLGTKLTAAITLPIVGLATASIKAYGDIQALKFGLESVTGSAEAAAVEFDKLREVAKLPGIGFNEAVKGSINLQSIGLSANKSRKILKEFGNAIATVGKGTVEFERAIYGVQQLANTKFPLGEDLNIIADVLPQVRTLLKDTFGKTRSDELAKMGVTSSQVLDVIINGLSRLPRVAGGINNAFENLKDSLRFALARIGEAIDKVFDIDPLIEKLNNGIDSLVRSFENLDPMFQKAIIVTAGLAAAIGPLLLVIGGLMSAVPVLVSGIGALATAFTFLTGPIGLTTLAIVGVVAAVVSNWDKIRPYLEETIDRFKRLWNEVHVFRSAVGSVGFVFEGLARVTAISLETIYENFKDVGKGILEIWEGLGKQIEGVLTFDFDLFAQGTKQGILAIGGTMADTLANNKKGLDDIGKAISDTAKKYSDFRFDLSKKTDLGIKVKATDDSDDSNIPILNTIKKVKTNIEELNAIGLGPKGLFDRLGNEFKTLNDLMYSETIRLGQVLGLQLPTVLSEGALKALEESLKYEEALRNLNEGLNNTFKDGIGDSISDAFSAIGTALATGNDLFKALGNTLLSTFGNILSQLGKQMIQYGVGLLAIKIAMKSLNPYVAIAAGAALVALGAGLTASVSQQSNNIGGGSSGSVSTTTGANTPNYSSTNFSSNNGAGGEYVFRLSGPDLIAVFNRNVQATDRVSAG